MATRFIVRGVHTSRAAFKATPQSLGFGNSTQGRERVLPTLNVSASARQNLGAAGGEGAPKTKQGAAQGQGQGQSGRAIDRRPRTPKGERGERRGAGPAGAGATGSTAPRTPRSPPSRRAPTAELPAEFFEGSELAAHEPSRARPRTPSSGPKGSRGKNAGGNASGRPKKQKESKGRGIGRNDGADASPRSPRPQRSYAPTRLAVEVKRDTSPRSLFGPASLIAPSLRGARDAPSSFWAQGMDPAKARKSDILRTAGDYTVFTPARPQGKGEKLAQSTGIWAIGMNRSIPMRRAAAGTDVFKTYLK